jgi:tRNA pseudouridine13 synthase
VRQRLLNHDIDPTGPLWGAGALRSAGEVASIERAVAQAENSLAEGLAAHDLRQERRSLRLHASAFNHEWMDDGSLVLGFSLPSGSFATALLREICATA